MKNYLRLEEFKWQRKRKKADKNTPGRGPESYLQERCVDWFRVEYSEYERLLFSVPNGGFRTNRVGAVMKKEGMVKGVSDLLLLIPKGKFYGMGIEFKVAGRPLSEEQKRWACEVMDQGYGFVVIRSFEGFKMRISSYWSGNFRT